MAAIGVLLFALGAVLAFALNVGVPGLDVAVVGLILMAVGLVAFLAGILRDSPLRRTRFERHVSPDGRHIVDETNTGI